MLLQRIVHVYLRARKHDSAAFREENGSARSFMPRNGRKQFSL